MCLQMAPESASTSVSIEMCHHRMVTQNNSALVCSDPSLYGPYSEHPRGVEGHWRRQVFWVTLGAFVTCTFNLLRNMLEADSSRITFD